MEEKVISAMFLPGRSLDKEKEEERKVHSQIEAWCTQLVPENLRPDLILSVQEMACGDPTCAPVDTVITIMFEK